MIAGEYRRTGGDERVRRTERGLKLSEDSEYGSRIVRVSQMERIYPQPQLHDSTTPDLISSASCEPKGFHCAEFFLKSSVISRARWLSKSAENAGVLYCYIKKCYLLDSTEFSSTIHNGFDDQNFIT